MSNSDLLQVQDGILFHRPVGVVTFRQVSALALTTMDKAVELQVTKTVFDTRRLSGFPSPSTLQRYQLVTLLAERAAHVRFAAVAHPEMIDAQRFGVTVALNRGFQANIFISEEEAKEWLSLFK